MAFSRRARLRDLAAGGVLLAATVMGTVVTGPPSESVDEISVAAFNIQVFGQTKLSKDEVMDHLVDIAQEFDVMVVQEIRDRSETVADRFLERINQEAPSPYALVEGPRLGRSNSKEQYAIYFNPARVEVLTYYTWEDDDDDFEREPLIAKFRSGNFDFTIVVCHIKPTDAEAELEALRKVAAELLRVDPEEDDILLMGDFNADGTYLASGKLPGIFRPPTFAIVIPDDAVTTTITENAYDRVILRHETAGHEYKDRSASVYRFDTELNISSQSAVEAVSDHFPVYAEFSTIEPDDD